METEINSELNKEIVSSLLAYKTDADAWDSVIISLAKLEDELGYTDEQIIDTAYLTAHFSCGYDEDELRDLDVSVGDWLAHGYIA